MNHYFVSASAVLTALSLASGVRAEDGISDTEVKIGMVNVQPAPPRVLAKACVPAPKRCSRTSIPKAAFMAAKCP